MKSLRALISAWIYLERLVDGDGVHHIVYRYGRRRRQSEPQLAESCGGPARFETEQGTIRKRKRKFASEQFGAWLTACTISSVFANASGPRKEQKLIAP